MESFAILRIMVLVLATLTWIIAEAAPAKYFNVMDYGAKGDGVTEDSAAFLRAWSDTCNTEGEPTLFVPRKQFFLRPISFRGPCKSKVHFDLSGGLFAPEGPEEWKKLGDTVKFIEFEYVTGLYIRGFGVINGRGKRWWDISCRGHPQLQTGRGEVRDIEFTDITFIDAGNPIIIDQYYCGGGGCPPTKVGVHVNNVIFSDIHGTSKADVAINFNCSENVACTAIKLENIQLTSSTPGKQVTSSCNNAFGEAIGTVQPNSCLKS
ncbi:probable polygalacturonase At1g80170 [Fagus crenata]